MSRTFHRVDPVWGAPVLVAGATATTAIAVAGIVKPVTIASPAGGNLTEPVSNESTILAVIGWPPLGYGQGSDQPIDLMATDTVSIPSDGHIALSTTNTTGWKLMLWFYNAQSS